MLSVKNIDVYYGASQALKQVSMEALPGEVTCIMGRNGVGKTSLVKAIAGQQTVQAGDVQWRGESVVSYPSYQRAAKGIAYVPQGRDIFSQLTVLENLQSGFGLLPKSERRIPKEIYTLFPVLESMLSRRGGDLSGGQQQQLAIARALITRPTLLILDEPTEGIQPSIIKDIQNVINRLKERGDMAIVLVEQYFDFARALADEYLVLDRGEVVMQGRGATMDAEEVQRRIAV